MFSVAARGAAGEFVEKADALARGSASAALLLAAPCANASDGGGAASVAASMRGAPRADVVARELFRMADHFF